MLVEKFPIPRSILIEAHPYIDHTMWRLIAAGSNAIANLIVVGSCMSSVVF